MNARVIGIAVTAVAGLTVLYNVVQTAYNGKVIAANPWGTMLSGGANLQRAYTFTPPFTGFEFVVLVSLAIGVLMVIFGGSTKKPD